MNRFAAFRPQRFPLDRHDIEAPIAERHSYILPRVAVAAVRINPKTRGRGIGVGIFDSEDEPTIVPQ